MQNLQPYEGHVLVKVEDEYEHVATSLVKKWDSKISGRVLKVADSKLNYLMGKRIFWNQFGVEVDDVHAFIDLQDVVGYCD